MAFDFIRGRQVNTDWSCGLSEAPASSPSSSKETIAKIATVGVVGLAILVLANQPSAKNIQQGHYERERRRGNV